MLKLQPFLALLAAAAIAAIALYFGFPAENAAMNALGQQWLPWMDDGVGMIATFGLMIVGALIAGAATRTNPLTMGHGPFAFGTLGLAAGVLLVGIAAMASVATGNGTVVRQPSAGVVTAALLAGSALFLMQSAAEEILFRGWLQPILTKSWGTTAAIVATAALFTGLHNVFMVNPWLVNLNLFLGGVVFGLLYRISGGILAPVLLHFGWNWSDAIFFGLTPNPGKLSFGSVFDIDLSGPAQLGGVEEGLMASIFATLLLIMIAISFIALWRLGWHETPSELAAKRPRSAKPVPAAEPAPPLVGDDVEITAVDHDKDRTLLMMDGDLPPPLPPVDGPVQGSVPLVQSATHEGCVRKVNEDRFLVAEAAGLFVVADGMGGHKFGDRASTMIIEHIEQTSYASDLDSRVAAVETAILNANQAIFAEAQTNGSRMGSTVVALMVDKDDYAILWAGDSRGYRWRNGDVERLTKDHTQVQEMVDKGVLKPEDVARHPMSHVLVRAVGVNPDFKLDLVRGKIEAGDVFFLCSDGIYDVLEEDEIGALLAKAQVSQAMDKMIKMSLDLGARDNVTGIIIVPETTV